MCMTKDKKNIYWIRHAESLSNISDSNYKLVDPGLTTNGYSQCGILKKYLETNKITKLIDLVVVSTLNRTLETCEQIIDTNIIPIISLDEIREHIDYPCHKREPITNKKFKYKNINWNYVSNDEDFMYKKFNGQEPKKNVISRCEWFVQWLKKRKEKNILVITHGNFLYPMFSHVLTNIENKSFFSNCEMRKCLI